MSAFFDFAGPEGCLPGGLFPEPDEPDLFFDGSEVELGDRAMWVAWDVVVIDVFLF